MKDREKLINILKNKCKFECKNINKGNDMTSDCFYVVTTIN